MIPVNHTVRAGDAVYDAAGIRRVATCSCPSKPRPYTARYINANKALYSLSAPEGTLERDKRSSHENA